MNNTKVVKNRKLYCPFCLSPRPIWKAGIRRAYSRGKIVEKQQYRCTKCQRMTVNPATTLRGRK